MPDTAVTVIGGGVVGLAVAAELAPRCSPLFLLERYPKYGQETSSRNSEVIHAGIYYPNGSLKAALCVEGRDLLYELCEAHDIPHRRITKIITAVSESEIGELDRLAGLAGGNGVRLERLSADQVHALEPNITSFGGLLSPTTGIVSAHGLMDYFYHAATRHGATVQLRCAVVGLTKRSDGWTVDIEEGGERSSFTTEWVVNAAGLEADTIAALAGIDVDAAGYRIHYCKGSYFALPSALRSRISRLVYPTPTKHSLGVHALLDLGGRLKFGPDVEYLPDRSLDYSVEESKREAFAASVRRILPFVQDEDLTPDMSGIRPKIQAPGEGARDFIIRHETDRGLEGLINLIGIESPGLTASPAIARMVRTLMGA